MKKTALLLVLTLTASNITAFGAPIFTVNYNPSNEKVTISGVADGITTVRVTDEAVTPEMLSSSNLPKEFFQVISDGNISCEFYVPQSMRTDYGKYNVYLTDDNGAYGEAFIYFDKNAADAVISNQVNFAVSESDFLLTVGNNASVLGIDCTNSDYSENVLRLMYSLYESYSDSADFISKYGFCLAVTALKGKQAEDVKNVMKKYGGNLGINYKNDFENNAILSAEAKRKLCELLAEMRYEDVYKKAEELTSKSGFKAVLEAYSALAAVKTADNWITVEKIYTQDFQFLKTNVVDRNTSYTPQNASAVFITLFGKAFASIGDLRSNFDSSVPDNSGSGGTQQNTPTYTGTPSLVGGGASQPYEEVDDKAATTYYMPTLAGNADFSDVPENVWYYDAVSILGGSGIISGDEYGNFRPNSYITRAEFAKLIVSAFSVDSEGKSFLDVAEDAWYFQYVKKASGAEIISGYEGNFRPNDYITRQDAAVIIYRTAKLLGVQYVGFQEPVDMTDISLYALTAVGTLYNNNVISGVGGGKFAPLENITRAQAAQLLYSAIKDIESRLR